MYVFSCALIVIVTDFCFSPLPISVLALQLQSSDRAHRGKSSFFALGVWHLLTKDKG